jgi:MFS transporter, ACS family, hexuronate transporter
MPRCAVVAEKRAGWAVAVAATLGMSVSYVDRQTLAAIAPAVRAALGIDHGQYGWLVSAFSMSYLVFAPVAGVIVDRLGARRGFALAVLVWSAVAGAHGLAASFASLFLLRALLGAAEAPSFPAAAQAIRHALPEARRPTAYGLLFTGSSIGAMVAAPVAVALEARFGFRVAFFVTAALGTLWVPLWLRATRGERLPRPAPTPTSLPRVDGWWAVASSPAVLRTLVAVLGSAPAVMFVLNWTSQYLVEAWAIPKSAVAGYLVLPPLAFDIGAVGFGYLVSRRARDTRAQRRLLALATLSTAALALSPFAPSSLGAIACFALSACGGGGVYVIVTADMLARVPARRTSTAGGMAAAAQSLAHIVASPLVGRAIDRTHGYSLPLVALGLVVLPTSFAFALWPKPSGQ